MRTVNLVKQICNLVRSEQVHHFLRVRPILQRIDKCLDRMDYQEWSNFGPAAFGPEPCEFMRNMLTDSEQEMILDFAKEHGISAQDTWEAYNVLPLQVERVADFAMIYDRDRTLANRANFSDANVKLGQLAVIVGSERPDVVAQLVRESDGSLDGVYEKLASNFPDMWSSGAVLQIINDADDFMADLKTEYVFGRVSPNFILLRLAENGLDLEQLYKENEDVLEGGGMIQVDALDPIVGGVISSSLEPYADFVAQYKLPLSILGIQTTFKRVSAKHHDHEQDQTPDD